MNKNKYMQKAILLSYISSLCFIWPNLNELIRYCNDFIIRKSSLIFGLTGSIMFTVLYIIIFNNEASIGKMKKSVKNFIIGFIPVFISLLFNIITYIYLSSKI